MEKEKNGNQWIMVMVLAVLILICGVGIVFLKIANRVPAHALASAGAEKRESTAEKTNQPLAF